MCDVSNIPFCWGNEGPQTPFGSYTWQNSSLNLSHDAARKTINFTNQTATCPYRILSTHFRVHTWGTTSSLTHEASITSWRRMGRRNSVDPLPEPHKDSHIHYRRWCDETFPALDEKVDVTSHEYYAFIEYHWNDGNHPEFREGSDAT